MLCIYPGFPNFLLQFCQLCDISLVLVPSSVFLVCFSARVFQPLPITLFQYLMRCCWELRKCFIQNHCRTSFPRCCQKCCRLATSFALAKFQREGQLARLSPCGASVCLPFKCHFSSVCSTFFPLLVHWEENGSS